MLELGAGTGVISRTFLEAGLPADRLVTVENDPNLANHLRGTLSGVEVLECNARALSEHLPARYRGRIASVVCGIPLVLLAVTEQKRFIDGMQAVAPGRGFRHFSYCAPLPLPARKIGLTAKREAWTPLNIPRPASCATARPKTHVARTPPRHVVCGGR